MKKLATALLLLAACAWAEPPAVIAIRNARIVTVSGPVIAKGTVVVRNGLIEAVGENVAVPPEALLVEGEGLTVYPGLIDALSTVGMPGAAPTATAGRGGRGATQATPALVQAAPATPAARSNGPEDRPQTTSWLVAADELQPTDRRIETVRSAGVTTAIVFPTRGIFGGQGSVVDLAAEEKAGPMIVESPIGQYIALGAGRGFGGGMGGGFPGSLMGIISYVHQVYLDAGHYKLVKDAYAKNPRGMERPAYDRALEGVLDSRRILLPANRLVEIDRMIRFAAELKQPTILYGAREAYRPGAAELLKKSGLPILVSLRWPTPPTAPDVHLEDESLRQLETYDEAPAGAGALQKAGVKFAFYSDGIDTGRELQRAVKKAIDAGLTRDQALRAMTLSPAEIYGVADRLGSIEQGKIGNLLVTRGDIFDNNTRIEMIVVDGKKYTPAAENGGRGMNTDAPGGNQ
ncbi:MAG TPA: amidohydrolase family protein [Candidatus Sulfopaludibacter sp.]|nr:amidohydrolase family protein [Candidatus Sulfopaludibacter sp.]